MKKTDRPKSDIRNPKSKDIRRTSSLNKGEFGHSPDEPNAEQDQIDFVLKMQIDESKRVVPPPVVVPDIVVNGEVFQSATFHPHVNPLMFTISYDIPGGKPDLEQTD